MENNNYWTSNLNSLTCRELRGRLRSLQESIDENRQRKRHQSLDRQIRSARISSRLEYERPIPVDSPFERPPSVFSAVSSNNNSSACVTCKRPLSVLDQNRPNSALTDGRAMVLATRERRENLRRDSAEAYENHLDCVGLIDESRSSFASSTETEVEIHSDSSRSNNSLVAPPPSTISGNQSIKQSMFLDMTPELHSPSQPSQSDVSTASESTVDSLQSCSPFPSNYNWSQPKQTDELAQCFLGAHRPCDVAKFVPESSFRLFYSLPNNSKVLAFSLPLTIAYRSNKRETHPFFNQLTREIEVFPVWLPYVRPYAQWQKK
ncbi:hypothetical protein M3Y94_00591000 [Aphelenchoides besseyi]|nr:hypothetical protein M3Y94_00591000 [Aphelenchoides besseyi]